MPRHQRHKTTGSLQVKLSAAAGGGESHRHEQAAPAPGMFIDGKKYLIVPDHYLAQIQKFREKEQEVEILKFRNRQQKEQTNQLMRLEQEKESLALQAELLNIQLEEMYNEKERLKQRAEQESAQIKDRTNVERHEYEKQIKEQERNYRQVVDLLSQTRNELNEKRVNEETVVQIYENEKRDKQRVERELMEARQRLESIQIKAKEQIAAKQREHQLLAQEHQQRVEVERANQALLERVAKLQLKSSEMETEKISQEGGNAQPAEDTPGKIVAFNAATMRDLKSLDSQVLRVPRDVRFKSFHGGFDAYQMAHSLVTALIEKVSAEPPHVIYEQVIESRKTMGFIIWKDDFNNNAMIMKTNRLSADMGIKVGSWICTINGRYVYGLPFEEILRSLNEARRPMRVGFKDDSRTENLNYLDALQAENRLKTTELTRLAALAPPGGGHTSIALPSRARTRRLEKQKKCSIQ